MAAFGGQAVASTAAPCAVHIEHLASNAVTEFLGFFRGGGGLGPEIIDVGSLPGPAQHQGGLGKAPAGAPHDLQRLSAR